MLWLGRSLPGIHVTWRGMSGWYELGGRTARAMLLPVLAFVAFSYVVGPQYPIWFMGLAALVARNLILVGVLVVLRRSALRPRSQPAWRAEPGAPFPPPAATSGRRDGSTGAGSWERRALPGSR